MPPKTRATKSSKENIERPRRERRLPNRLVENQVLTNITNSKESNPPRPADKKRKTPNKNDYSVLSPLKTPQKDADNSLVAPRSKRICRLPRSADNKSKTPNKNDSSILSPFKTPQKDADNSLIAPRPKRICRLPSKFDDHLVSPNKFIPIGCHASTPILPTKVKSDSKVSQKTTSRNLTSKSNGKPTSLKDAKQPKIPNKEISVVKASDSNNNPKQRILRSKVLTNKQKSPEKSSVKTAGQKLLETSFSFRVLEDKKKLKRDSGHLDVYEFTYDPNEEPPPQKKKRKKAVKKRPAKPKTFVFKNNYDQNVNKALAALKNVVAKNTKQVAAVQDQPKSTPRPQITVNDTTKQQDKPNVTDHYHMSVGVEDIAADIEPLTDHHEINYSPVTSPNHGKSPMPTTTQDHSIDRPLANNDPLNLQEEFSFFDEPPVASSSMNMSVRRPHASPWRVQFEQLPIKWQVNTYVKANMTPAVESSFINFDDSKKKHVYTNMVAEANEELPEIVDNNQPNLKQTSIISFIKDVVERSATKKKRARSVTPVKANSLFEDMSNISVPINKETVYKTPRKNPRTEAIEFSTPQKSAEINQSNSSKSSEEDRENSKKKKKSLTPGKSDKEQNIDGTFFGFDESEDQENVSPVKIDNPRVRALRPRARAVLQEINAQTGPSRAKIPLAAKTKIAAKSVAVNQVYEELKSASDAPVFPEKNAGDVAATDVVENMIAQEVDDDDDDSQSVHLFEDIELVHHLKPTRKSYGKAKKVTFQASTSDSETQVNDVAFEPDSDEDDLADLTFTMPNMEKSKPKKKAKPKKKELSKKEKAEMEAWAAGFNSMCEDIEEFPLMVE